MHQEGKPSYITEERIRALNGIAFDWGTSNLTWNDLFEQLCEYNVQFGDCLVPRTYSVSPRLGHWVSNQRRMYQEQGTRSPVTAERIRALDSIGFNRGHGKTDSASNWRVRFQQLCEFKAQCGVCLVTLKYSANPELGVWVSKQRSNYRLFQEGKASPITAERIEELESLEFKWEQHYVSWNERFEQLRELTVQFAGCVMPIKYSTNPKLGKWVSKQRQNYKLYWDGKPSDMTEQRIQELERVEFKWSLPSTCKGSL